MVCYFSTSYCHFISTTESFSWPLQVEESLGPPSLTSCPTPSVSIILSLYFLHFSFFSSCCNLFPSSLPLTIHPCLTNTHLLCSLHPSQSICIPSCLLLVQTLSLHLPLSLHFRLYTIVTVGRKRTQELKYSQGAAEIKVICCLEIITMECSGTVWPSTCCLVLLFFSCAINPFVRRNISKY